MPTTYMKEQQICVAFNLGYCKNQKGGDHQVGDETIHHYCAGCFKKSNGSNKSAHPVNVCKAGPFGNLFG